MFTLCKPSRDLLPRYQSALERGWSRSNIAPEKHRLMDLEKIAADAQSFVAQLDGWEACGPDVASASGHLQGMTHLLITTNPANVASRRVIESCGGILLEHYTEPPMYGGQPGLKYHIELT